MFASLLLLAAVPAAPLAPTGEPPRAVAAADLTTLQNAGLPTDGPALLRFLQRRADPDGSLKLVDDALVRLAENDKERSGPAQAELVGYGAVALSGLQRLANRVEQPAAVARARATIAAIEGPGGGLVTLAALRAVAALRPDGVETALFAFLPFAESEATFREAQQLLGLLCPAQGELPAPYVQALKDPEALRRQVAAEVLCAAHGVAAHALVRPLLNDPRPSVRLRVALALTESYDPAAVPVLLDLLARVSAGERQRIDDALTRLAGDWGFAAPTGDDRVAGDLRRALWRAWWDTLGEQRLVELFKAATHTEEEYLRWQEAVARLNAAEPAVRDKAVGELVALGPGVLPLVRRVALLGSPREKTLAAQVVTTLERGTGVGRLPECAPRLLALRRPAGTVQLLLDALPWMDDPLVEQQIRDVLPMVAAVDGKPAPALTERLASKLAVVRGAAATALARVGGSEDLARIRELFADPEPVVRLEAALALARRGERNAVPVLIDLLAALPSDRVGEAEDLLLELAGSEEKKPPTVALGNTPEERTRCKEAWAAWWRENGAKVSLDDLRGTNRPRTLLLIESYDPARRNGRVVELDRAGRILFDVSGMSYPMYAERVGHDRMLIAEQGQNKVTERDRQGRVVKEWSLPSAFHCQRLRNGHTFMAGRNLVQMLDRDGKALWTYPSQNETILGVARQRDGQTLVLTYQGTLTRLDASGKATKTTAVPVQTLGGVNSAEILPGDRVLLASTSQGRVVEFDETGKLAWEATVPAAQSASRLPGGTTLVVAAAGQKLLEIERSGRVVQEWKDLPVKPIRALMR